MAPAWNISLSLIQTAYALVARSKQQASVSIPSGWFGDFNEAESTFTKQGLESGSPSSSWTLKNNGYVSPDIGAVTDPALRTPVWTNPELLQGKWFFEAGSGGPNTAFQEDYPVVPVGVSGNRVDTPPWVKDDNAPDQYIQEYKSMFHASDNFNQKDAHEFTADDPEWFDNSLTQLDGMGRQRYPYGGSLLGWTEKSVNTTLSCQKPGCTASATLMLFDAGKQEARDCSLAIHIHPTDFSSDREKVALLKVNGKVAMRDCDPRASYGCQPAIQNGSLPMPLHSCLPNLPVDKLVDKTGAIVVEGQITDLVDDCPYKGNLLSGVLMGTCMVREKTTTTTTTTGPFLSFAELKCKDSGCTAESFLSVLPKGQGSCKMNVTVFQTDYDQDTDDIEVVQFIQVEGTNVSNDMKPAKNPCKMQQLGQNVTAGDRQFLAVKDYDLTSLISVGMVTVKGKISDQVDECAHDGHMFHANVTVRCDRNSSSLAESADSSSNAAESQDSSSNSAESGSSNSATGDSSAEGFAATAPKKTVPEKTVDAALLNSVDTDTAPENLVDVVEETLPENIPSVESAAAEGKGLLLGQQSQRSAPQNTDPKITAEARKDDGWVPAVLVGEDKYYQPDAVMGNDHSGANLDSKPSFIEAKMVDQPQ